MQQSWREGIEQGMGREAAGATGKEGKCVSKEGQALGLSELARLDPGGRQPILLPTVQAGQSAGEVVERAGASHYAAP